VLPRGLSLTTPQIKKRKTVSFSRRIILCMVAYRKSSITSIFRCNVSVRLLCPNCLFSQRMWVYCPNSSSSSSNCPVLSWRTLRSTDLRLLYLPQRRADPYRQEVCLGWPSHRRQTCPSSSSAVASLTTRTDSSWGTTQHDATCVSRRAACRGDLTCICVTWWMLSLASTFCSHTDNIQATLRHTRRTFNMAS
jgi:hypothetical protein